MKKNPKRMEPVLKYRKQIEDDFQKECKKMREILLMEEAKLSALEIAQERSIMELQEKQDLDISLNEACLYYSFLNSVTQEISKQKDVLKDIQSQFEEKRKLLLVAYQDKRIIEILQDKMQQEVNAAEAAEEVQFLDDLSEKSFYKKKINRKNVNNA